MAIFSPHALLKLVSQNLLIPFSLYLRLCVVFITTQYFSSSSILGSRFFFLIKFYLGFFVSLLGFFFLILLILCGYHIMHSHPTYLPISSNLPSAPATSSAKLKPNIKEKSKSKKTKKQNKNKIEEELYRGGCSVAHCLTQFTL